MPSPATARKFAIIHFRDGTTKRFEDAEAFFTKVDVTVWHTVRGDNYIEKERWPICSYCHDLIYSIEYGGYGPDA